MIILFNAFISQNRKPNPRKGEQLSQDLTARQWGISFYFSIKATALAFFFPTLSSCEV